METDVGAGRGISGSVSREICAATIVPALAERELQGEANWLEKAPPLSSKTSQVFGGRENR